MKKQKGDQKLTSPQMSEELSNSCSTVKIDQKFEQPARNAEIIIEPGQFFQNTVYSSREQSSSKAKENGEDLPSHRNIDSQRSLRSKAQEYEIQSENGPKEPETLVQKESLTQKSQTSKQITHVGIDTTESKNTGCLSAIKHAKEFIFEASAPLFTYEEERLEELEPEKKHTKVGSRFKLICKLFILLVVFIKIVLVSIIKYGTEKNNVLSTEMHNEYQYQLKEYPFKKLLPMHWFLELNREDVVDRMECLINEDAELCQHYDEMKCSVHDKKSYAYESCMLRTYRKFGKDQKDFCNYHYKKSDLYSHKDKSTVQYLESYYSCLQHAGKPKGKKYCDAIIGLSPLSNEEDFFACYQRLKVKIEEYGEALCKFQNLRSEERPSKNPQEETSTATCHDNLTVSDSDGDTCEDWYDDHPEDCGKSDDETFKAGIACCSCGGGSYKVDLVDPYVQCLMDKGLDKIADLYKCDSITDQYDQRKYRFMCWPVDCTDDNSVADNWGDTCESYYNDYSEGCNKYDTETFQSGDACCSCGGGFKDLERVKFAGTICENDDSDGDTNGNTCSGYYDSNPEMCGQYDIETFIASEFCCACGARQPVVASKDQVLVNDDYYKDSQGNTCSDFYQDSNTHKCGMLDTKEFKAEQMCLSCGGGIPEQGAYCDQTRAIIESQRKCYRTISQTKTVGYCDSDVLIDYSMPSSQTYLDCYNGIGLNISDTYLCDHLYPMDDSRIGGSYNLLSCYQTFGITITLDMMHDKCLVVHKEDMYDQVDEYHKCLKEFGGPSTLDHCLLDHDDVFISIDTRQLLLYPKEFEDQTTYDYEECYHEEHRNPRTAYFCKQRYDSEEYYKGQGDVDELRTCFETYNMPMSPILDCQFKFQPAQDQFYKAKEGIDSSIQSNCRWYYDGKCQEEWTDYDCNEEFFEQQYKYDYGYSDDDPETHMITNFDHVCGPIEHDYTLQDQCNQDIDYTTFNQQLNTKLEEFMKSNMADSEFTYEPFTNNTFYCDSMFAEAEQIESKQLCYEMVEQPMGPEKCFQIQPVTNDKLFQYNFFYKYLCLTFEYVELDEEAIVCLDLENIHNRLVKERNDCLKSYESGLMPQLTKDGNKYVVYIYQRPIFNQDDAEDLTRVLDKETDFTLEDIKNFICNRGISSIWQSSPSQERQNNRIKKMNELNAKMKCDVFSYVNITRDNLVVHLQFDDSESFKNQFGKSYYTEEFNKDVMVIKRTDSNEQYFNLTFSEDLNLIQILSKKLYHYKSNSSLNYTIKNFTQFTDFTTDSKNTKLFESYSHIISRELVPNQNLMGEQTRVIRIGMNVTKRILGLPYEFANLTELTIDIAKNHDTIKPLKYESLVKEEISHINQFRVNFQINFVENVIHVNYFTMLDVFSELGGLNASVNTILASLAALFLISYFHSLASMIKRKYIHKVSIQLVKQNQTVLKEIKIELEQSLQTAQIEKIRLETEGNATKIEASFQKQQITEIETLLDEEYTETYQDTEKRLDAILVFIQEYRPEALEDVFEYNANKNLNQEWDKIEHKENTDKREIYMKRKRMTLAEIVQQIHLRMSFYNIYRLIDNIDANKIKIRKVKYQTRLHRDQIETMQSVIQDQANEIMRLNQAFDERVKKLENNQVSRKKIKKQQLLPKPKKMKTEIEVE